MRASLQKPPAASGIVLVTDMYACRADPKVEDSKGDSGNRKGQLSFFCTVSRLTFKHVHVFNYFPGGWGESN